jgi:hypothetical protein
VGTFIEQDSAAPLAPGVLGSHDGIASIKVEMKSTNPTDQNSLSKATSDGDSGGISGRNLRAPDQSSPKRIPTTNVAKIMLVSAGDR